MKTLRAIGVQDVERVVTAAGLAPLNATWTAADGLVRSLPEWVDAVGAAACGRARWVVVQAPAAEDGGVWQVKREAPAGQLVLDLAPGRYLVDVYDLTTGLAFSRESGEGAPLVVGLPVRAPSIALSVRAA
ncbi:MAG: hypothetical protein AB7I50_07095 [Vicinamibacterales bacterium]